MFLSFNVFNNKQKHIYLDKPMDPKADYINHHLNTSKFRNTFRFSKAQRFSNPKTLHTDFNYYVAPRYSSRSTSFGIGNRPNLQNLNYYPGPDRYNISKFPVDQRGTSLNSREKNTFGSLAHQIERKVELPSPDSYNNVEIKGKSFSLGMKLPGEADFVVKKRVPGPAQYQALQISATGRYINSRNRNTRSINFGVPVNGRPSTTDNSRIGPGSYDIYNIDSNFSDNKVSLMKNNTAKKFGTGKRKEFEDKSKLDVPGPGQYQAFSCFGNSFKPRIC